MTEVKMQTCEVTDGWQQQKENEVGMEMMRELIKDNQNLRIQLETKERESTAEIEVIIANFSYS